MTQEEVIGWFKAHIMPSEHRRKLCFWVVGDENAPAEGEPVNPVGYQLCSLDEFRKGTEFWPLTKDPMHAIIAKAYETSS